MRPDRAGFDGRMPSVRQTLGWRGWEVGRTLGAVTSDVFTEPGTVPDAVLPPDWAEEVRALAAERDAVILAHNYQLPEIQDVADHVATRSGSRGSPRGRGVHDRVLRRALHGRDGEDPQLRQDGADPDERAGCSLAETINAEQLRHWKAQHPGAVVVSYVNTTAAVKAETDICCRRPNAVEVVQSIREDREILFCPDQFLGRTCSASPAATTCTSGWGVPRARRINGADLRARVEAEPRPSCFIHPECGCATSALYLASSVWCRPSAPRSSRRRACDRGGEDHGEEGPRRHRDRDAAPAPKANPLVLFEPVNRAAVCKYMKMITPAKLLRSLRDGTDVVDVPPDVADRARLSVERMIAIGQPSPTGE
jgi:quinolinate synthase